MGNNIIILGSNGQLGSEFIKLGPIRNPEFNWISITREVLDLSKLTKDYFLEFLKKFNPHLVINCSAYTNVDRAEEEQDLALRINAESLDLITQILAMKSIPFVHFSTDYIFGDSTKKKLKTTDTKNPISTYGATKLIGENIIKKNFSSKFKNFYILRISWVFGEVGNNFVKTILKISKTKSIINVVSDQYGGPTSSASVAKFIIKLIPNMLENTFPVNRIKKKFPWGIYHFQGKPTVSWSKFASKIIEIAYEKRIVNHKTQIKEILTSEYKSLAKRQLNSRLDCINTEKLFEIKMPRWEKDLEKILIEIKKFE